MSDPQSPDQNADQRPEDGPGQDSGHAQDPQTDAPAPRSASVRLNEDGANAAAAAGPDQLDAANASLFDALKITFRLLQGGMIVVALLYLLSGFQSVQVGERAIALVFGKVQENDLGPGFRFSLPYPVGELVRIQESPAPISVDREFWLDTRGSVSDSYENLPSRFQLTPGVDGSVVTADGNIAHTRWTMSYVRSDPAKYAENVLPEDEQRLLRSAVRRGAVTAIAGVTIDELLKQAGDEPGSVTDTARRVAQDMLDRHNTGIEITRLTLDDKIPPTSLRDAFSSVQQAESGAAEAVTQARNEARLRLNSTAGLAADPLIGIIERYERAVELGEVEESEVLLTSIEMMLEGNAIDLDGDVVESLVSGEVTELINRAKQDATTLVNRRSAEYATFLAKSEQFAANPLLTIQRSWREAFEVFMARDTVQVLASPPGTDTLELIINQDPDIRKELDRAQKAREAEEARQRALDLQRDARFERRSSDE
ncbi:MAG: SPFH domain-containing protein [Planctomycetota bacterium]